MEYVSLFTLSLYSMLVTEENEEWGISGDVQWLAVGGQFFSPRLMQWPQFDAWVTLFTECGVPL